LEDFINRNVAEAQYATLDDVLTSMQYGSSQPSTSEPSKGSVPIVGIPNILSGKIDLSDLHWANLNNNELARFLLRDGDVLVVRTNGNPTYVGRSALVYDLPPNTIFASYLIRLQADSAKIRPTYLGILLNTEIVARSLRKEVRSSAGNYNINMDGIRRQRIPVPSLHEQDCLVESAKRIEASMTECKMQVAKLRDLRKELIRHWL
jgi:restriction endonuclease S subunit